MNIQRIYTLVHRSLVLTLRGLDPITDLLYWPLYDIIIWGFAFTWITKDTHDTTAILTVLSSLILWQAVSRVSLDISFNFLSEMWARNVVNFFVTPLTLGEWMASVMISGLITASLGAAVGITAVWLLYSINILSLGWFLIPLFLLLIGSGWAIGFLTTAALMIAGPYGQKLVWIAAWFFGPYIGVFYPLGQLPIWAQLIGKSVPMTYVFQVLRTFISDHTIEWSLLAWALGMTMVYFIGSALVLHYCFYVSRQKGLAQLEDA